MRGETLIYKIFRPKIIRILAFFARTNGRKRKEERKEGGRRIRAVRRSQLLSHILKWKPKYQLPGLGDKKKTATSIKGREGRVRVIGAEGGVSY